MPQPSWPRARERRILLLVALLTLSFVLTALLAYNAQDAARSHRRTAERTLRDYASLAALQFAIHAKEAIYWRLTALLNRPVEFGVDSPTVGRVEALAASAERLPCPPRADTALYLFRIELRDRKMALNCRCTPPMLQSWLRDTVSVHATTVFKKTWEYGDIVGT